MRPPRASHGARSRIYSSRIRGSTLRKGCALIVSYPSRRIGPQLVPLGRRPRGNEGGQDIAEIGKRLIADAPGATSAERHVDADGFRIRYLEAGRAPAPVHLYGTGGLRLSRAHDLLAQRFRVIAFEVPGFGESPENQRSRSISELAQSMARDHGGATS